MAEDNKVSDSHVYRKVSFREHHIVLLYQAVKHYHQALTRSFSKLDGHEALSEIFNGDLSFLEEQRAFLIRIEKLEAYLLKETENSWPEIDLTHKTVRLLKSIWTYYLEHLRHKRESFSKSVPTCPSDVMAQVDARISELEEMFDKGVFKDAEAFPLLIDETQVDAKTDQPIENELQKSVTPRLIGELPIRDSQLRTRCLQLVEHFNEKGLSEMYDNAIMEATKILEDRLRTMVDSTESMSFEKLIHTAFNSKDGKFRIHKTHTVAEGMLQLFRGCNQVFRNETHHKLGNSYTYERVLQIIGFIDYLLHLAEEATLADKPTTQ